MGSTETGVLIFKSVAISYPEPRYVWLEVNLRRLSLSKQTVVGSDQGQWPGGSHSVFQEEAGWELSKGAGIGAPGNE